MDKPETPAGDARAGSRAPGTEPYSSAVFTRSAKRYFRLCDDEGRLYSEAGLCLALRGRGSQGPAITPAMLRSWYDDDSQPALRDAVRSAYLQIQQQIETDPRYWEKSSIASRAVQLLSQRCFGGGQPQDGARQEPTVQMIFGGSVEASDFE